MNEARSASLQTHFSHVEDLGVERTREHELLDMMVMAVCAVIGGADNWVEIAEWGVKKLVWLRQCVPLESV